MSTSRMWWNQAISIKIKWRAGNTGLINHVNRVQLRRVDFRIQSKHSQRTFRRNECPRHTV